MSDEEQKEMKTFEFGLDQMATQWERGRYYIEAESYDKALIEANKIFLGVSHMDADDYEDVGGRDVVPYEGTRSTKKLVYINEAGRQTTIRTNHGTISPTQT